MTLHRPAANHLQAGNQQRPTQQPTPLLQLCEHAGWVGGRTKGSPVQTSITTGTTAGDQGRSLQKQTSTANQSSVAPTHVTRGHSPELDLFQPLLLNSRHRKAHAACCGDGRRQQGFQRKRAKNQLHHYDTQCHRQCHHQLQARSPCMVCIKHLARTRVHAQRIFVH